ncbi:MAG: hypothetical protein HOA17_07855 [Candidatus Melainabacteria bacterium]|jgi:putative transposase|nr:hypothetical protein [Candidatus Melainabacteria bacterium]
MTRDLSIEFPNAFYHAFSRGINRQRLFYDDEDHRVFIHLCRKAVIKYGIRIYAFCLMSNHYHLYLCTPHANIAKTMKFINQSYAIFFLAKYPEKDGHVFKGRYKRKIVDSDQYSKTLINYIHNNPVAAKIKEKPEEYQWSSYQSYIKAELRYDFIDYSWTLNQFGSGAKQIDQFIKFHQKNTNSSWDPEKEARAQIFLADDSFIKSICDQYIDFDQLEGKSIKGVKELKAICNHESLLEVINSRVQSNDHRFKITAYLLKEYTDITNKEIGKLINKSEAAVAKNIQRFKKLLDRDQSFKAEIRNLIKMSNVRIRP